MASIIAIVLAVCSLLLLVRHRRMNARVRALEEHVSSLRKQFRLVVNAASVAMNLPDDLILDLMRQKRPIDMDAVAHLINRSDELLGESSDASANSSGGNEEPPAWLEPTRRERVENALKPTGDEPKPQPSEQTHQTPAPDEPAPEDRPRPPTAGFWRLPGNE